LAYLITFPTCMLQTTMLTVVKAGGNAREPTFLEAARIEAMTGAVIATIAMTGTGLAINANPERRSKTHDQIVTICRGIFRCALLFPRPC
jgi:hypothetical protein